MHLQSPVTVVTTVLIFAALLFPSANAAKKAEAPAAPAPKLSITSAMSAHGCKIFAQTLLASPAEKTFEDNIDGGLTVFCPTDAAMTDFSPKFKNLTADAKQSVLEYHGVPVYNSLSSLRTSNGVMNTLATDGANNYDFVIQNDGEDVTVKTKIVTARITATVVDKDPVAIFAVDKVLEPQELFKGAPVPAPAPAPEADAESPKPAGKKKHKSPPAPKKPADSPADGPAADDVADAKANSKNGAFRDNAGAILVPVLCIWFSYLLL